MGTIQKTVRRVLGRVLTLATSLYLQPLAMAAVLHPDPYFQKVNETYVPGTAGACCIGEFATSTNSYLAQSFVAIGGTPKSLTIGLANNSYPNSDFKYSLLVTTFASDKPGAVLYETSPQTIPATLGSYQEYQFNLNGVSFVPGGLYAWIIDTYVTRDGNQDSGAYYADLSGTYTSGSLFFSDSSGSGRQSDFSSNWINSGLDASFLLIYKVREPSSIYLLFFLLCAPLLKKHRFKIFPPK